MARSFGAESLGADGFAVRGPVSPSPLVGCALVEAGSNQLGWTARPVLQAPAVSGLPNQVLTPSGWASLSTIGAVARTGDSMSGPLSLGSNALSAGSLNVATGATVLGADGNNEFSGWLRTSSFAGVVATNAGFTSHQDGGLVIGNRGVVRALANNVISLTSAFDSNTLIDLKASKVNSDELRFTSSSNSWIKAPMSGAVEMRVDYAQGGYFGLDSAQMGGWSLRPMWDGNGYWQYAASAPQYRHRFVNPVEAIVSAGDNLLIQASGTRTWWIDAETDRFSIGDRTNNARKLDVTNNGDLVAYGGGSFQGNLLPTVTASLGATTSPWNNVWHRGTRRNYNSGFTGTTNIEAVQEYWFANTAYFGTQAFGTGVARNLVLQRGGIDQITLGNGLTSFAGNLEVASGYVGFTGGARFLNTNSFITTLKMSDGVSDGWLNLARVQASTEIVLTSGGSFSYWQPLNAYLPPSYTIRWTDASNATNGSSHVLLTPNGTGQLDLQANSGLRIRNQPGNGWSAIQAGAATFNGDVALGGSILGGTSGNFYFGYGRAFSWNSTGTSYNPNCSFLGTAGNIMLFSASEYTLDGGPIKFGAYIKQLPVGMGELQTQVSVDGSTWQTGARQLADAVSGIKHGFYGATPVARQSIAVAASDAASTQTLVNSIRSILLNLGLAA